MFDAIPHFALGTLNRNTDHSKFKTSKRKVHILTKRIKLNRGNEKRNDDKPENNLNIYFLQQPLYKKIVIKYCFKMR